VTEGFQIGGVLTFNISWPLWSCSQIDFVMVIGVNMTLRGLNPDVLVPFIFHSSQWNAIDTASFDLIGTTIGSTVGSSSSFSNILMSFGSILKS
jgi:hypothetical protein